ncbi:hypothetical protein PCE1_003034 [Barthelona sp. PCE]
MRIAKSFLFLLLLVLSVFAVSAKGKTCWGYWYNDNNCYFSQWRDWMCDGGTQTAPDSNIDVTAQSGYDFYVNVNRIIKTLWVKPGSGEVRALSPYTLTVNGLTKLERQIYPDVGGKFKFSDVELYGTTLGYPGVSSCSSRDIEVTGTMTVKSDSAVLYCVDLVVENLEIESTKWRLGVGGRLTVNGELKLPPSGAVFENYDTNYANVYLYGLVTKVGITTHLEFQTHVTTSAQWSLEGGTVHFDLCFYSVTPDGSYNTDPGVFGPGDWVLKNSGFSPSVSFQDRTDMNCYNNFEKQFFFKYEGMSVKFNLYFGGYSYNLRPLTDWDYINIDNLGLSATEVTIDCTSAMDVLIPVKELHYHTNLKETSFPRRCNFFVDELIVDSSINNIRSSIIDSSRANFTLLDLTVDNGLTAQIVGELDLNGDCTITSGALRVTAPVTFAGDIYLHNAYVYGGSVIHGNNTHFLDAMGKRISNTKMNMEYKFDWQNGNITCGNSILDGGIFIKKDYSHFFQEDLSVNPCTLNITNEFEVPADHSVIEALLDVYAEMYCTGDSIRFRGGGYWRNYLNIDHILIFSKSDKISDFQQTWQIMVNQAFRIGDAFEIDGAELNVNEGLWNTSYDPTLLLRSGYIFFNTNDSIGTIELRGGEAYFFDVGRVNVMRVYSGLHRSEAFFNASQVSFLAGNSKFIFNAEADIDKLVVENSHFVSSKDKFTCADVSLIGGTLELNGPGVIEKIIVSGGNFSGIAETNVTRLYHTGGYISGNHISWYSDRSVLNVDYFNSTSNVVKYLNTRNIKIHKRMWYRASGGYTYCYYGTHIEIMPGADLVWDPQDGSVARFYKYDVAGEICSITVHDNAAMYSVDSATVYMYVQYNIEGLFYLNDSSTFFMGGGNSIITGEVRIPASSTLNLAGLYYTNQRYSYVDIFEPAYILNSGTLKLTGRNIVYLHDNATINIGDNLNVAGDRYSWLDYHPDLNVTDLVVTTGSLHVFENTLFEVDTITCVSNGSLITDSNTVVSDHITVNNGYHSFNKNVTVDTLNHNGGTTIINNTAVITTLHICGGHLKINGDLLVDDIDFCGGTLTVYGELRTSTIVYAAGSLNSNGITYLDYLEVSHTNARFKHLICNHTNIIGGYLYSWKFEGNYTEMSSGRWYTYDQTNITDIHFTDGRAYFDGLLRADSLLIEGGQHTATKAGYVNNITHIDGDYTPYTNSDFDNYLLLGGRMLLSYSFSICNFNFSGGYFQGTSRVLTVNCDMYIYSDDDKRWSSDLITNGNVYYLSGKVIVYQGVWWKNYGTVKITTLDPSWDLINYHPTHSPSQNVMQQHGTLNITVPLIMEWKVVNYGDMVLFNDSGIVELRSFQNYGVLTVSGGVDAYFHYATRLEYLSVIQGDGDLFINTWSGDTTFYVLGGATFDMHGKITCRYGTVTFYLNSELKQVGWHLSVEGSSVTFPTDGDLTFNLIEISSGVLNMQSKINIDILDAQGGTTYLYDSTVNTTTVQSSNVYLRDTYDLVDVTVNSGELHVQYSGNVQNITQDGGTIDIETASKLLTVQGYFLNSGHFTGVGGILINEYIAFIGGRISGTGVFRTNNLVEIYSGVLKEVRQRSLDLKGRTVIIDCEIDFYSYAQFGIAASGTLILEATNIPIKFNEKQTAAPSRVHCLGRVEKYGFRQAQLDLYSYFSAPVDLVAGELLFSRDGEVYSYVTIAAGANFEITNGFAFGFGSDLTVFGNMTLSGGTVDFDLTFYNFTNGYTVINDGDVTYLASVFLTHPGEHFIINGGDVHFDRLNVDFANITVNGGTLLLDSMVTAVYLDQFGGDITIPRHMLVSGIYNLYGGSIIDTSLVTVSGPLNWYGGSISGSGRILTDGGVVIYSGVSAKVLEIKEFFNTKECVWLEGDIVANDGALFKNLGESSIVLQPGGSFLQGTGDAAILENQGTIEKFDFGVANFNIMVDHSGFVIVHEGRLTFTAGVAAIGDLDVKFGSVVEFSGPYQTFYPAASVHGDGMVEVASGASITFTCKYNVTGFLKVSGGAAYFEPGLDLTNLGTLLWVVGGQCIFHGYPLVATNVVIDLGYLSVDAEVEIHGTFDQNGGEVDFGAKSEIFGRMNITDGIFGGDGSMAAYNEFGWYGGTIKGGNIFELLGTVAKFGGSPKMLDQRRFELKCNTYYTGGDITGRNGASLIITTVAQFDLRPGANMLYDGTGARPELGNANRIIKRESDSVLIEWYLNTIADISLLEGDLSFSGGGFVRGNISLNAATQFEIDGTTSFVFESHSRCIGFGRLALSGGQVNVHSFAFVSLDAGSSIRISGSYVTVDDDAVVSAEELVVSGASGSVLSYDGVKPQTIPPLVVNGGSVRALCPVTMPNGAIFTAGECSFASTVDFMGATEISGGVHSFHSAVRFFDNVFFSGGEINGEGLLNFTSNVFWDGGKFSGTGTVYTEQTVTVDTTATKEISERYWSGLGTFRWRQGDIELSDSAFFNNSASFVVDLRSSATFSHVSGLSSKLHNQGTFDIDNDASAYEVAFDIVFDHIVGDINIKRGILNIGNEFSSYGDLTVDSDGVFIIHSGELHFYEGSYASVGHFKMNGGTCFIHELTWDTSSFEVNGGYLIFLKETNFVNLGFPCDLLGGVVDFRTPPPITSVIAIDGGEMRFNCLNFIVQSLSLQSGTLTGKGEIVCASYFLFVSGLVDDIGSVASSNVTFAGSAGTPMNINRFTIINRAFMFWQSGEIYGSNGAKIINDPSTSFEIRVTTSYAMTVDNIQVLPVLENHGTIRKLEAGQAEINWEVVSYDDSRMFIIEGDIAMYDNKVDQRSGSLISVGAGTVLRARPSSILHHCCAEIALSQVH